MGPEKVGKFSVAKTLAQILQCPNNFCHTCNICQEIKKGYHLDTLEFHDDGDSIKIEQIRALISNLNMSTVSRYKVILIDNLARMTLDAANSFLKSLEEPHPRVIFLLTSENTQELLSTIVSRTRVVKFGAVSEKILGENLRQLYPDLNEEIRDRVVALATGRPGMALKLIKDPELLNYYQRVYNDLKGFFEKPDLTSRFLYVNELVKNPGEIKVFLEIFLHLARSLLLHKANFTERPEKEFEKPILKNTEELSELTVRGQNALSLLKRNINPKLLLENLLLNF